MNFTLNGGTDQQRRWVQDAISQCSFPVSDYPGDITVQWVDPLPVSSDIGHAHSYMVTQQVGVGDTFLISIAPWADDFRNPNNQGLPDPAADICDFYKQSFVHEIGHVVSFVSLDSDDLRTAASALYWTTDITGGSGRRYGTLADWSAGVWVDNTKEAIAECFKCAFYTGRLIFMNRTHWIIDEPAWPDLMKMLAPGGVVPKTFSDDYTVNRLSQYQVVGDAPVVNIADAVLEVGGDSDVYLALPGFPLTWGLGALNAADPWSITVEWSSSSLGPFPGQAIIQLGVFDLSRRVADDSAYVTVTSWEFGGFGPVTPNGPDDVPTWLRLWSPNAVANNITDVFAEQFTEDPDLGGGDVITFVRLDADGAPLAIPFIRVKVDGSGFVHLKNLVVETVRPFPKASAPYPFGPIYGTIAVGGGFRGAVRIG